MTEKTNKTKAKRVLKDITFDHDNAHLALCSASQGAANNWNKAVVMKSLNFSPEVIEKAQKVQVTLELPEFLRKFFGLWYEDAEILARMMGYVPEEQEDYEDWIEEKLSSYQILKSLNEAEDLPEALSKLTGEDYLDVLNDQSLIEKAMKELAEGSNSPEVDNSTKTVEKKVEGSPSKVTKKKEKQMTQATDMVEKSQLVAVEKALEDQKVALEKALAQVAQFEEAQKQAVIKSKTDAVKAVVKDEKQAAAVVKAALALDSQEDVDALIAVFKSQAEVIEKSGLFQEVGATVEATEDKSQESGLTKILKAKYAEKK